MTNGTYDNSSGTYIPAKQTRCDLDDYAKHHFLKDHNIYSAGQICTISNTKITPLNSHSTGIKVHAYEQCPWCCNYCNESEAIRMKTFS